VARECGLIDQSAEVYISRFLKGSSTDPDSELCWESVMQEGNDLSTDTLKVANLFSPFFCSILLTSISLYY
jgi:cation-transporting ATPase 13A2